MHSVYLVRHGKSSLDGTEEERGLEPEGEEHARYLGGRLAELSPPIKAVYSSPYRRAQLTIEPFAEGAGLAVTVEDAFHEKIISDGPVDDLKAARVKMWEDFGFRLPGGESNEDAQQRAVDALARLRQAHPDEAVVVSGHGTLIALTLNTFDPSFGHAEWRAMPMPDIYRLDFDNDKHVATDHVGCPGVNGFKVDG